MKPLVAVFGGNRVEDEVMAMAESLGRRLVDEGYRVVCGGLGGAMAAVARGAHTSAAWTGGEILGVLPGWTDDEQPNPWIDIPLRTDMGSLRNTLVARVADAALAVGGGSGTLSEIALAWHEGRPLGALACTGGWAARLAGERLDDRRTRPIEALTSVDAALAWLDAQFPRGVLVGRGPLRWWHEEVPWIDGMGGMGDGHEGEAHGSAKVELERLGPRLEALAGRVRAWNLAHGQARRALVCIDAGAVEHTRLVAVFERLPELQPVAFADHTHELAAGWLVGALGPGRAELDAMEPAALGSRLRQACARSVARGSMPWLAWSEGSWTAPRAELARVAGFTLQLVLDEDAGSDPADRGRAGLVLRTRWT